ncbi:MAG: hypothetical protein VW963_08795 [Candidatus Neomarinimicrobiota bacterium]
MIDFKRYTFFLSFFISLTFSDDLEVKPIIFTLHSSNGSDWVYEKTPLTSFGAGLSFKFQNPAWSVLLEYMQLGFIGQINHSLYSFSSIKSLPYLDKSKDADGYWSEYVKTKIAYKLKSAEIYLGIFDWNVGHGVNSIHISKKSPSFPQIGFSWQIKKNLNFIYFHGFLNSGVNDSSRSVFYENEISQRIIDVPRNVAYHRLEWRPINNFVLGLNESVIYSLRNLDFHYLIPVAPFYPIENYLGDTDNIQMGFDFLYTFTTKQSFYVGFFMDELTPEWIFNSKNHNWFAYQLGYGIDDLIFKNSSFIFEYNWTDQRIYKHKYKINDFYSHGEPLGFWAGPHSEELLANYSLKVDYYEISIDYSMVKRGLISDETTITNYNDTYNPRYSDGYELKNYFSVRLQAASNVQGLSYIIGVNQIRFENKGLINDYSSSNKYSIELGIFYNYKSGRD